MPESTTPQPNKRKRPNLDDPSPRAAPVYKEGESVPGYDEAAMNQISAFNQDGQQNGGAGTTAEGTAAAALGYDVSGGDASFQSQASAGGYGDTSYGLDQLKDSPTQVQPQGSPTSGTPSKPAVGSDEWHKIRKDNHKEVERRRRETINEGINELAKIVPGCEKNKGSILQRAVQYIGQLKDAENTNLEKWTLEKLLLDQAINELSQTCDRLKSDYQKAWDEKEAYKRACDDAGVSVDISKTSGEAAPPSES